MVGLYSWVEGNWFNIVQTAGIVGSLCLAAAAANREAKASEIENLLTISNHHREVWKGVYERRELERIFRADIGIQPNPVTVAEEEFINLVVVHFQTTWFVTKTGGIITFKELAGDARAFFSLPLPRAVWEKTKEFRNPKFVRFVERALGVST